jgi:nucleoside 2-deoxyribosyltransferase
VFKVYLAGPEVFLPNATEIGDAKKRICAAHGLAGLFPLDQQHPQLAAAQLGMAIYHANVALMTAADAIIANLTPFRGPAWTRAPPLKSVSAPRAGSRCSVMPMSAGC